MKTFKVGDRVRYVGDGRYLKADSIRCCGTVTGQDLLQVAGLSIEWDDGQRRGNLYSDGRTVELVPLVPTDQELADEYRALRAEIRGIALELIERGYMVEYNPPSHGDGKDWYPAILREQPDNYRFVKTETVTEMVEVKREKEIAL